MSDPVHLIGPAGGRDAQVRAAVGRAADATGVDFSLLIETARRESALNPQARARTSSAAGLFQFIESTWLDMVRRHGAAHGLGAEAAALQGGSADPAARRQILALRDDPEIAARMAGEFVRENAAFLSQRLGRPPGAGELYAAHVMGADGAARLIEAAQRGAPDAAALFPQAAAANRGLFYGAGGEARSAAGLLDKLSLDAGAAVSARPGGGAADAPFSPALAQALFAMALLPLMRTGEEAAPADPLRALLAYNRAQRL